MNAKNNDAANGLGSKPETDSNGAASDPLLTLATLASEAGVTTDFLHHEIARQRLRACRLARHVIRVRRSEWNRYLEANTVNADLFVPAPAPAPTPSPEPAKAESENNAESEYVKLFPLGWKNRTTIGNVRRLALRKLGMTERAFYEYRAEALSRGAVAIDDRDYHYYRPSAGDANDRADAASAPKSVRTKRVPNSTPQHLVESGPAPAQGAGFQPEFIPLPANGRDPYFGLSRSTYYDLERKGMLKLVRIRKPGHIRGRVLIPFAETAAALRALGKKTANAIESERARS